VLSQLTGWSSAAPFTVMDCAGTVVVDWTAPWLAVAAVAGIAIVAANPTTANIAPADAIILRNDGR
jgi:hypothetical protein